jgi:hypothetical protein
MSETQEPEDQSGLTYSTSCLHCRRIRADAIREVIDRLRAFESNLVGGIPGTSPFHMHLKNMLVENMTKEEFAAAAAASKAAGFDVFPPI